MNSSYAPNENGAYIYDSEINVKRAISNMYTCLRTNLVAEQATVEICFYILINHIQFVCLPHIPLQWLGIQELYCPDIYIDIGLFYSLPINIILD